MSDEPLSLDYFAGGVPAGAIFQMHAQEIWRLLSTKDSSRSSNTQEELCLIGLVAYFEAFCRDAFASLINIAPPLLARLKEKNYDVSVDSLAALGMKRALGYNVGFLVCERLDFGTARKINAMYSCLVGITPFSKDEAAVFDEILSDRNLLVHHGGIYTHAYSRQRLGVAGGESRTYFDSLNVDLQYVHSRFNFLYATAKKITNSCHKAVEALAASGHLTIDGPAAEGLFMFKWWDEDNDEA
jgi:hypothetical protein